jgi:hypothetical protein
VGGNGGLGGRGGPGGKGGAVDVRFASPAHLVAFDPNLFSHGVIHLQHLGFDVSGGAGGKGGQAGEPGAGGKGGRGGKAQGETYILLPGSWQAICRDGFRQGMDSPAGGYGKGWPGDPKPEPVDGAPGGPGTQTLRNPSPPRLATALVRTSQLQMFLEGVRARYLEAGCAPDGGIVADLEWLAGVLLNISERGDADDPQGSKPIAAQMLKVVAGMLNSARNGCDLFGKGPSFVPNLSLNDYQKSLEKSLKVLETNNDACIAYRDKLAEASAKVGSLKSEVQKFAAFEDLLAAKLNELNDERKQTQREIDRLKKDIGQASETLKDALDKMKAEIRDKVLEVSPQTLINCFTQVAFLGLPFEKTAQGGVAFSGVHAANSALLGATQVAAVNEGLTTVLSDSGEPVKRELLIEQLDTIEPGKLQDHLKARENGTYVVEDGRMLTMRREELDTLCRQFRSRLTKGAEVSQAMGKLVDLIELHGRYLEKYNSEIAQELDLVSQIRATGLRRQQAESDKAIAALTALPDATALVSELTERSRLQCLYELSLAARALAFWKADPYRNVADLLTGKPKVLSHLTLLNAWNTVRLEIMSHLEKAFSPPQAVPEPAAYKSAAAKGHSIFGEWVVLTREHYKDEFECLEDGLLARFTLRPGKAIEGQAAGTPLPFHGKTNMRLTRVRAFFPGVSNGGEKLTVRLTHNGPEWVRAPDGEVTEYRHRECAFEFTCTPPKTGDFLNETQGWVEASVVEQGGSVGGALTLPKDKAQLAGCTYRPIGPFTDWAIELRADENRHVDRTKIDRMVLDFHGWFQSPNPGVNV